VPRLYAIGVALLVAGGGFGARCQSSAAPKIHVGSTWNCSKMITYVRPIYPKKAKCQRIQGVVKLRATVSVRGDLRNIEVLEGDPIFVPAALRAAKKCRFSPCLLNGDPVEPITEIVVPFTLTQ
jgi:protein TonB